MGVEPTSKTCRMAALPQAWSALETFRRGTDEPLGTCAPWSRPPSGGVAAAHLVPLSGRPKPPFQGFNEPGTQRSRGLARSLGCPRQREPVRSYRWQFVLGGLMRGPAVQPPPAPGTRITTCRNRSPPCVGHHLTLASQPGMIPSLWGPASRSPRGFAARPTWSGPVETGHPRVVEPHELFLLEGAACAEVEYGRAGGPAQGVVRQARRPGGKG